MIKAGIAGMGFMGWIHYLAYERSAHAQLAAIATRDPQKRSGDWRGIKGNFGPPGEQVDVSGLSCYADLDEMLRDDNLDLIDICLPPNLHEDVTIRALEHGKHVFCEKPMSLTTESCNRMVDAAKQNDRKLLIGHVLPMFPEYAQALEWIRSDTYGAVRGGSFKRIISDPTWLKDFFDPQRVGGPLVDLHVHDAHWIRLLFGMPQQLMSQGRMRGEVVEFCHTLFKFGEPDYVVHAVSGVIPEQGRAFTHGFELQLQRATVLFEFAVIDGQGETIMPLTVLQKDGTVVRPDVGDGDPITAFVAEIDEVARSIQTDQDSAILAGQLARDALLLCHRQTESVLSGDPVHI